MNPNHSNNRSRRRRLVLALCCLALMPLSASKAADKGPFDGVWDTTVSCSNTQGAVGYSYRFSSVVKEGTLHGGRGTKGQPGWLQLDGKIEADGTGKFYANGLVGASEAAVGHRPAGTDFGYHVDAKFLGDSGTGKRVEGRACEVTFAKVKKEKDEPNSAPAGVE
jgi:hypothetical protein